MFLTWEVELTSGASHTDTDTDPNTDRQGDRQTDIHTTMTNDDI